LPAKTARNIAAAGINGQPRTRGPSKLRRSYSGLYAAGGLPAEATGKPTSLERPLRQTHHGAQGQQPGDQLTRIADRVNPELVFEESDNVEVVESLLRLGQRQRIDHAVGTQRADRPDQLFYPLYWSF